MHRQTSRELQVSQNWAGDGFGTMHIPRIGQEVIVDFLNGNPDYPIITGRVYNADQMPPWELPANKTQSGIKTRSSKGGQSGPGEKNGPGTANALRFEDAIGAEQLWLHAQKDQLTEVEHDEDKWVGNDRRKTVDGNENNTIHKNRTEIVDLDEDITIHGNRTERVDLNEDVTVHMNRKKTIDINETDLIKSDWDVTVGANKTETVALTYTESTGIAKMMNVGMLYSRNVGMAMNSLVGLTKTSQVGIFEQLAVGHNYAVKIGEAMDVEVGKTKTESVGEVSKASAGKYLELTCGQATIVLTEAGGIYLKGTHIDLQGGGNIRGDAGEIDWNCEVTQDPPGAPGAQAADSADGVASPAAPAGGSSAKQGAAPPKQAAGAAEPAATQLLIRPTNRVISGSSMRSYAHGRARIYLRAGSIGRAVDALADRSPSLQNQLAKLTTKQWTIKYGDKGGGSYTDRRNKLIVLDSNLKNDPASATQVLAHEVGHALYPYKDDWSSKSNYVNARLKDEGAATLNNIKVEREITANGGPDIGVAGNQANAKFYNQTYDQYQQDGNAEKARQAIGNKFGSGEITSVTKQPYSDYYGAGYDQAHPKDKP